MYPKSKLDDLPGSDNKAFWENAEVNTGLVPKKIKFEDQPHFFERMSGHQARCTHCDWGFELDPGDKIIDGHLFDKKGKKVL